MMTPDVLKCCLKVWSLISLLPGEQTAAPHQSPVGRCWVNAQECCISLTHHQQTTYTLYPEMSVFIHTGKSGKYYGAPVLLAHLWLSSQHTINAHLSLFHKFHI